MSEAWARNEQAGPHPEEQFDMNPRQVNEEKKQVFMFVNDILKTSLNLLFKKISN